MPTLIDYRRRIRSVKSTQQITRAMKFVAAAKLRRAQEGVYAARPYAHEILRVLRSAAARVEEQVHPLLARREEKTILALVMTSDRGLCGAFNSNVIRHAVEFLRAHREQRVDIIAIGRKGRDTLRRRGYKFVGEYLDVSAHVDFSKAKEVASQVAEMYASEKVDAVYAIYNEFKSVLVQKLCAEKLLPIDPALVREREMAEELVDFNTGRTEQQETAAGKSLVDYIYEQPIAELFAGLVPRYLESETLRILLESAAAEHAARMTAMDSATRNAKDLIDRLTLEMNKIRQAGITKELIEIVSGAASATS
ncbi:MAG TPA: ATP synthase F1 subunit gamma [Candidatus Acidoferrum sp.]|nr:ATP synthase F1 subunit gamma [Candidatus Acidoferrum sp.]